MSTFTELAKINVNQHTEKKGNLTYLSWAWAVDQLLRQDDAATWEYRFHEGKPYVQIGETCMVFCTVKAFGKERTAQLPVMDYKNKAIVTPDAMEVNTAMQRCLAKAIALHGIGLYIYAGEDLPDGNTAATPPAPTSTKGTITPNDGALDNLNESERMRAQTIAKRMIELDKANDLEAARVLIYENNLTNEMQLGIWHFLQPHSSLRNRVKKLNEAKRAEAAQAAEVANTQGAAA
jgi:hypothetical protein